MTPSIAHVITESVPFGGAQRNTLLTLEGLRRDGYRAELVCGAGGPLIDRARDLHVPVHVVPSLVRKSDPLRDVRCFTTLVRLFRTRHYDVVHTHSTKAGLLGRIAARIARVPVVLHTFHGFPFPIDGNLRSRLFVAVERGAARCADGSICVAEALRREVGRWGLRPSHRLTTIYSGIELGAYPRRRTPAETRRQLGLEGVGPIVGSIGHLRDAKAQEVLLESIALLRPRYPDVRLLLIGEGERRAFLEERVAILGLGAHVRLLGERDDVADLLDVFDVYASSSRWEGVGRALTEALYWGLPVAVTAVYGVPELVENEVTGLAVSPDDPAALATAIDRLLGDRALARRLGAAGRQRVVDRMDVRAMIGAIEELYEELLGERGCRKEARPCTSPSRS